MKKADGSRLAANHRDVAPINCMATSLFKQVKLFFDSQLVYDSSDTFAYKAYMETHLNHSASIKETFLQAAGYYKEQAGLYDTTNQSFLIRNDSILESKEADLVTYLSADAFPADRLLLNNIEVRLELHRNSDAFYLNTLQANEYKVVINSLVWYVRKVEPMPSMLLALENRLVHQPARYPIRRTIVKTEHIEAGRTRIHSMPLSSGHMPRRIVIGFVSTDAYNGNFRSNPFNFQHFDIRRIQVVAAGVPRPYYALEMNFAKEKVARAYYHMLDGLNIGPEGPGNDISISDFIGGSTFFVFDLTPDASDQSLQLVREGSITVSAEFGTQVPAGGIKLLVYQEFESILYIGKHRDMWFDFSG